MEQQNDNHDNRDLPELVFGLIGPTGTDLERVGVYLADALRDVGYRTERIRLSNILKPLIKQDIAGCEFTRINESMNAGDELRRVHGCDIVALLGVSGIWNKRLDEHNANGVTIPDEDVPGYKDMQRKELDERKQVLLKQKPLNGMAYVIHSLKHKDEVRLLRRIYGRSLYLISVYSHAEKRQAALDRSIGKGLTIDQQERKAKAIKLMERDQTGDGKSHGQQVSKIFHMADLFVDLDEEVDHDKHQKEEKPDDDVGKYPRCAKRTIRRFVHLLFKHPFNTPLPDEYCQFLAHAAALRSGDLGRQVGAVIATDSPQHDVVALGTNEVPRAGGGQFWPGDPNDHRDCKNGADVNDLKKRSILTDLLNKLAKGMHLKDGTDIQGIVDQIFSEDPPEYMKNAELMNIIGFYRAVHAETAALLDAAKRGASVRDCIMHVTTFPCHECARHIVAAGIKKVIFLEPYPKSLASDQYPESISVEKQAPNGKIPFVPFVGIAPSQYMQLFAKVPRKDEKGQVIKWDPKCAQLRYSEPKLAYISNELDHFSRTQMVLSEFQNATGTGDGAFGGTKLHDVGKEGTQ